MTTKLAEQTANGQGSSSAAVAELAEDVVGGLYCTTDVNILVIDDETPICNLIQSALSQPHFHVDTVNQPSQIEDALQTKPYHVIISDYVMPGVTSETVFDWIKQHQ